MKEFAEINGKSTPYGIRFSNERDCYLVGFDVIYFEAFESWKKDGCPSAFSNNGMGINLTARIEWVKCDYINKGWIVLSKAETLDHLNKELVTRQVNANAHQAKKHCKLVG
jgi:hypothetical protein